MATTVQAVVRPTRDLNVRSAVTAWLLLMASPSVVRADEPPHVKGSQQVSPAAGRISSEDFVASPFSEFFRAGDYARALDALDVLAKQYPDDPLIIRYRAVVLDRLGRYEEALPFYDQLLARDPNHVPTRFFRAMTYARMGQREKAIDEWKWVQANSPSKEYRVWSEEELGRLGVRAERRPERKKFYIFGNEGWEYDSNVLLKSNDPGIAVGSDKNASRLALNLGLGYRAIQRPGMRLTFTYTARQSLNDDSLNEFNFMSHELAADLRKRVSLWDHDVTLGSRYELSAGFLDDDLFSVTNELRLSSEVRLTPRTRSYAYNRFTFSDFGPDGSNPSQTSRDGFGYDLGLTQYFYSEDFRRYVFVGEELNLDASRGSNFDRYGTTTRLGVHTPVPYVEKTDLDTSMGFRWGQYPDFVSLSSADPRQRLDHNWDYYVAVTRRFTPRLSMRVFYRYINANNRNDFYQYDRQIAGVQTLFTQYF